MREFIILPSNRLIRYYKNSVYQESGWNEQVIEWCAKEASRQELKPHEYWGGLLIDEMKLQVRWLCVSSSHVKQCYRTANHSNFFLIMQEDLQMTVKGGRHQLSGVVSLGGYYDDVCKIKAAGIVLHQCIYK